MAQESLWGGLAKWGASNTAFSIVVWAATGGFPLVAAAATTYLGYTGGIPWAYLLAATSIVFCMTATGLLRFSEWLIRRTASNKITFNGAQLAFDYTRDDETGKNTAIDKSQPMLMLTNSASFEIRMIFGDVAWSVDDKTTGEAIPTKTVDVAPGATLLLRLPRVEMHNAALKERLEGRIKFKFIYGRVGRERYEIAKHLKIEAILDPLSGAYLGQSVGDVVE